MRRRTLLQAGLLPVGLMHLPAGDVTDWRSYVVAPARRTVAPARVLATTGDVRNPDGLLRAGGARTVLTGRKPPEPPAWPAGTTATASSYHPPNSGNDGQPRTYGPDNAIDGHLGTFWNDAEPATYPAVLTVTAPSALTLPGVTVRSNADGVPVDFTVEAGDGTTWRPVGTVTGNAAVQVPVPFAAPVTATAFRIVITRTQDSARGQFARVNELWPGLVAADETPSVTVDFGKVVVGWPRLRFAAASDTSPGVLLAFSETTQFLTDRSDFDRQDFAGGPGTDAFTVPAAGADWTDELHGFRYLKVSLDPATSGRVAIDSVLLEFSAFLGTPDTYEGWFVCSDDELNRYWYAASYTNELTLDTFRAADCDPRGAASPSLEGKLVLHDGPKRDRDPYVGDLAVSGRTLYLTHPAAAEASRNVLADLADHQRADGWIPPASINGYTLRLFDYPLWWVITSWDYVLYTGDVDYARAYWPHLVKVLDGWYPSVTDANGLLSRGMNATGDYGDYAFLPRSGAITYYNANYVQALGDAARLARLLGHTADAERWTTRAGSVAAAVNARLWDAAAGAYLDSAAGPVRHGQDGNAIAVTAGVADPARAGSALSYLDASNRLPYGNAFMDNDTLPGVGGASERVYAFTSYPEIVARFRTGRAESAIDQIKRTYGWMHTHDPGLTQWEGIGPGGTPYEGSYTSMAHGWSTGVLPALTNELLGVTPTGPGFTTWAVTPRPGTVTWARGRVPTPHGPITVEWRSTPSFTLKVTAPEGTTGTVTLPTQDPAARAYLNGRPITTDRR
ncbi:alpha-L-rhamnosidase C-terminal domain-containing protein [Actinoplanes sp. NPDC049265]|uniref:alpha-L-rhamnosidase-related protein n=1 Tax=Actinoplanes sp. NPDC049265 TaxID=3363902 RepID=UPI00371890D5